MSVESMLETDRAAQEAVQLFESQPEFVRIELGMRKGLDELEKRRVSQAAVLGSQERLEYVVERFEIRAQAFLELVCDVDTQNAFMALLRWMAGAGFQEYTGWPMGALRPVGAEAKRVEAILELVPKWEWAGYERLGKGSAYALGRENQKGFAPRTIAQQRRKAVDDYIAEVQAKTGKLITRTDIWKAAGYRNRTQFERWQRNDPRCTAAADRNIRQILQRKPPLKKN